MRASLESLVKDLAFSAKVFPFMSLATLGVYGFFLMLAKCDGSQVSRRVDVELPPAYERRVPQGVPKPKITRYAPNMGMKLNEGRLFDDYDSGAYDMIDDRANIDIIPSTIEDFECEDVIYNIHQPPFELKIPMPLGRAKRNDA